MTLAKSISFILLVSLFSCNNSANTNSNHANTDTTRVVSAMRSHDYFFEPDTSIISGILKVEMYYGRPNYGEDTATDEKEYSYILYPDDTINVIQKSNSINDSGFDVTTNGLIKFQLAPMRHLSLHSFVNKKIKVTGTFYGSHTGHHHTAILMSVEKVEEIFP